MAQVFVYEECLDVVNAERNGTMNLLKSMPEGTLVNSRDLHLLRKEFIKRIFTFYIVRLDAGIDEDQNSPEKMADGEETPADIADSEQSVTAHRLNRTLDRMDSKLIFILYQRLAINTKERLEQAGILPEVCPPETKGRHQSEHY